MPILYRLCSISVILVVSLLHQSGSSSRNEISAMDYLTHLLSRDSKGANLLQAIAETSDSNDSELDVKVQKMESQLGLLLAELQAEFLATKEARNFLMRASAYGLPSFDNLKFYDNFVVSYDNRLKQPIWSMEYYWCKKMPRYRPVFRKNYFYFPDLSVFEYFRSNDEDYKSSVYYRGHFTAAFNQSRKPNLLHQSFQSSNVAPMVHNLHRSRGLWHRLESYVTFMARRSKNIHVISGVLYLPADSTLIAQNGAKEKLSYRVIGSNRVAVPSHFYKVLLHESKAGTLSLEAFIVPNSAGVDEQTRLDRFRIDVGTELPKIEELTGLRFFELLDRNHMLHPNIFRYGFVDRMPRTLNWMQLPQQPYVLMK